MIESSDKIGCCYQEGIPVILWFVCLLFFLQSYLLADGNLQMVLTQSSVLLYVSAGCICACTLLLSVLCYCFTMMAEGGSRLTFTAINRCCQVLLSVL